MVSSTIIWPGLCRGIFPHCMNYGETHSPAEYCILNCEICPLSLSRPGEDCEIMIYKSFHLNVPRLSYIHQPRPPARLRAEQWWKLRAAIRCLLYTSPALLFPAPAYFKASVLVSSVDPTSLPTNPACLPPCLSFSREVSTISLATAG